jgi:hypothetical protein
MLPQNVTVVIFRKRKLLEKQKKEKNAWDKLKCRDSTRGFHGCFKAKWLKFFLKQKKNKDQTWWCKTVRFFVCEICLLKKHYFINQYFLKETA